MVLRVLSYHNYTNEAHVPSCIIGTMCTQLSYMHATHDIRSSPRLIIHNQYPGPHFLRHLFLLALERPIIIRVVTRESGYARCARTNGVLSLVNPERGPSEKPSSYCIHMFKGSLAFFQCPMQLVFYLPRFVFEAFSTVFTYTSRQE